MGNQPARLSLIADCLSHVDFFASLGPDALKTLSETFTTWNYTKGQRECGARFPARGVSPRLPPRTAPFGAL